MTWHVYSTGESRQLDNSAGNVSIVSSDNILVLSGVTVSVGNGTKHIRYVDPDFLTHIDTYEFDFIIDALQAAGFTPDKNIIAFPVRENTFSTQNAVEPHLLFSL